MNRNDKTMIFMTFNTHVSYITVSKFIHDTFVVFTWLPQWYLRIRITAPNRFCNCTSTSKSSSKSDFIIFFIIFWRFWNIFIWFTTSHKLKELIGILTNEWLFLEKILKWYQIKFLVRNFYQFKNVLYIVFSNIHRVLYQNFFRIIF